MGNRQESKISDHRLRAGEGVYDVVITYANVPGNGNSGTGEEAKTFFLFFHVYIWGV